MNFARLTGSGAAIFVLIVCLSQLGCSNEPGTSTGTGRVLVSVPLFDQHGIEWFSKGDMAPAKMAGGSKGEAWDNDVGVCQIPMSAEEVLRQVRDTLREEDGWELIEVEEKFDYILTKTEGASIVDVDIMHLNKEAAWEKMNQDGTLVFVTDASYRLHSQ